MNEHYENGTKIVCVSDTHGHHEKIKVPEGDILVFAGDIDKEYDSFNRWFVSLPHKYKVFVAGNHDLIKKLPKHDPENNLVVLDDSCASILGIRFYGHPWCRINNTYFQTVFKKPKIPSVDIVITHTPGKYIMDLAWDKVSLANPLCSHCNEKHGTYSHWGSENLRNQIRDTKPKFHIFGHVHDQPGNTKVEGFETIFVNASSTLGSRVFKPQVFYYPKVTKPEFRYLCSVKTYLDEAGRMVKEKSKAVKWTVTKDNFLVNENGGVLSYSKKMGGMICVLKKEKEEEGEVGDDENMMEARTRWKYYDDELVLVGGGGDRVLDVDKKDKSRVILWKRLNISRQKWRFVK